MESLYAPMFASQNCILHSAGLMLLITLIGAFVGAVIWLTTRQSKANPQFLPLIGGCSALFFVIGAAIYFTTDESMVSVSTDWKVLEYRYCKQTRLGIERYALSDIKAMTYRKEISVNINTKHERISHYLDIVVSMRESPISIPLDGTRSEVNIDALQRLAPQPIAEYRTQR